MPADALPIILTVPEFAKRMHTMYQIRNTAENQLPLQLHATINSNHSLTQKIIRAKKADKQVKLAQQAYNLALLSQNMLRGSALTNFIKDSVAAMSTESERIK